MKNIKVSELDQDINFEKIKIKIHQIVVNPDNRVFVILIDENERQAGLELNSYEASMLSFVHQGFHKYSHINTIHQLYVKFLENMKTKIEEIDVESKVDDIIYCTLRFVDKNYNRAYAVVSIADALILSRINDCPLYVIKNTWEDFDMIDDWDYEDFIVDFEKDDNDE